MNLTQALNVALPELPARSVVWKGIPRVDPNLIVREQTQDGMPIVMVLIPGTRTMYPFTPEQWGLMQLFDGERTYQEIADVYTAQTSIFYSEQYVKEFAEATADQPFWYKTPQEKNIALWEKLTDERKRKAQPKSRFANLAEITFSAWDPDRFLTRAEEKLRFVFGHNFLVFNLLLFAFTAYVWIARWSEIGRDSLEYYTFTHKGFADIVEFWVLIFFVGFLHESSHGLVCKHTGGEVHRMGFLLIYLTPCFFCDTTEAWAFGTKWQRIATMAAGLWSELILCGFASLAWWGLPSGGFVHELSYKIILIAGVAAILINLNPLVKLDGYYIFTEMLEISELKERSTEFTTSWIKKHIFRLPVEVPYVPTRRRMIFVPYALVSGAYSYVLLFFVVRFLYNVIYRYNPQWAFIPALGLAWILFRSRIRCLVKFMYSIYLDKKEFLKSRLKFYRIASAAAVLLTILFTPFWCESVSGRFLLEPIQIAVLRPQVPGTVMEVNAQEGQVVMAGAPLVRLSDLNLESQLSLVEADYAIAKDRLAQARLQNIDAASLQQNLEQLTAHIQLLRAQVGHLTLTSEISGVVVTPRTLDCLGSYVLAGTELARVADVSAMRAKIYVAESDLPKVHVGSAVKIRIDGLLPAFTGSVTAVASTVSAIKEGVMIKQPYVGLHPPHYYLADITVRNAEKKLWIGMTGEAKIVVRRRSLAGMLGETLQEYFSRKLW